MEQFGKFLLHDRIATGGIAETFRATLRSDPEGRSLLVKRIFDKLGSDKRFMKSLVQQVKRAASLKHPLMVSVLEFGSTEGQYYMVTEFVDGVDCSRLLAQTFRKRKFVPVGMAVFLVSELLRALQRAHRVVDGTGNPAPIVHGGLGPTNILISRSGEVKIADFGTARPRIQRLEQYGPPLEGDSVVYMAPEQAQGQPASQLTDIFSVGALLGEFLCGRPLFFAPNDQEALLTLNGQSADDLFLEVGRLPLGLVNVARKALAPAPENRYQDVASFRQELLEHLKGHLPTPSLLATYVAQEMEWTMEVEVNVDMTPEVNPQVEAPPPERRYLIRKPGGKGVLAISLDSLRKALQAGKLSMQDPVVVKGTKEIRMIQDLPEIMDITEAAPAYPVADQSASMPSAGPHLYGLPEASRPSKASGPPTLSTRGDWDQVTEWETNPGRLARAAKGEWKTAVTGWNIKSPAAPESPAKAPRSERLSPDLWGPNPPQWLRGSRTGSLDDISIIGLLYSIASQAESGTLTITCHGIRKGVVFKDGTAVAVDTNLNRELLGEHLVNRGMISRMDLDMGLAMMNRFGGNLGRTLVELGILPSERLEEVLMDHERSKLFEVFTWRKGNYVFDEATEEPRPVVATLGMSSLQTVAEGVRRGFKLPELKAFLAPALSIRFRLRPQALDPITAFRLNKQEGAVIQAMVGKQTLEEILLSVAAEPTSAHGVLYLLLECGFLRAV